MRLNEIDPDSIGPGQKISAVDLMSQEDPDKLENYIRQHCSDVLKDIQAVGRYLYRGLRVSGQGTSVFVGQSRQDRKPKDTVSIVSAFFDRALDKNGFTALRSNSIFVTSDRSNAQAYGALYAIFPMNGFNFTYTNQMDLIIKEAYLIDYPKNFIEEVTEWVEDYEPRGGPAASYYYAIEIKLKDIQRLARTNDPNAATHVLNDKVSIRSNLSGMAYYVPDDPFLQKYKDFDVNQPSNWSMDAAIENLEPRNTDIQKAMREGKEICINGKYVALPAKAPFINVMKNLAGL